MRPLTNTTKTLPLTACLIPILAACGSSGATPGDAAIAIDDAAFATSDLAAPPDLASVDLQGAPDLARPVTELEVLGGAQGLGGPIVDTSPDEAGNLWAVAPDALYIRRDGETTFRRYTNADGLHIFSRILSVAGGGVDDGYVGLEGVETGNEDDEPAIREPGKAEHVTLHRDGTITSKHYWDMHTDVSDNYWITRSAYRLLYIHEGPAAGHLFMGGNHGIGHIYNDRWGDHVHVEAFYMPEHSGTYGSWYGLALDPATNGLWTCGKIACGLQNWDPDPRAWVQGHNKFSFTVFTDDHEREVPHGYRENFVGVAVATDGTAYFLSRTEGLAAWLPGNYDYQNIHRVPVPGMGQPVDIAADVDGTLFIADTNQVLRLDPRTSTVATLPLPVGDIRRLYLDRRVQPRALYIASGEGVVIYRGK